MGKRTYNNGSYVLKSPPLDPFYIEKESDYHPNLRHFPDYRRLQYDSFRSNFIPAIFQPNPVRSTYQDDYNIQKNEEEQFKDFKTVNCARCVKPQNNRDFDVLLNKYKGIKRNNYVTESKNEDYGNSENISKKDISENEDIKTIKLRNSKSISIPSKQPVPNFTIYDTTYNRMAKVNDLPELEQKMRENKEKREKNKSQYCKNDEFMKIVNRNQNQNVTSYNSCSNFQNVVDESKVFQPYPNFPAPNSIYPLFHNTKGDFRTTYGVLHDNRKFSIPEPDIYKIKRRIFQEERELIKDILKKNNRNIKGNVNVNIYNP